MIDIPSNFFSKCELKCVCGEMEDMLHIYKCELYNKQNETKLEYDKKFDGNLNEQIERNK